MNRRDLPLDPLHFKLRLRISATVSSPSRELATARCWTLEYEQNLSGRKIAVVALSANSWNIIRHHLAKIADSIDTAQAGSITCVECGDFSRQRRRPPIKGLEP